MRKNITLIQYTRVHLLYTKLLNRFQKSVKLKRFEKFAKNKQQDLLSKIDKLRKQLEGLEKAVKLTGAALSLGLMLSSNDTFAQAPVASGSEYRVNTYTTSNQKSPSIAADSDGDYVIVWDSYAQDNSAEGIYAQRYNASGVAQGSEFKVNSITDANQLNPSVAMDADGDFVVTWESFNYYTGGWNIRAQRFNSSGVSQGNEFSVNTYTNNKQINSKVAMDSDGDFVVTWDSYGQDYSKYGVFAQRFNASGVAQGSEFKVNTYNTDEQKFANISMDGSGNFVITWQSYGQDGQGHGVYAKRYNTSGVAQGSEFLVNTYTTGNQYSPSVAIDADGDFVISWSSYYQDNSSDGVYAKRFNASGVAQGSEFLVNTHTTNAQFNSSVAIDAYGDFLISWTSINQDGHARGVFAQRFNALGVAQGSEFQINTYYYYNQDNSKVAVDADGDIAITWVSPNQDGSNLGIYARRYTIANHRPTDISLSASSINENVAANSTVGTLSSTDADAGNTFTYSLVSGTGDADNAQFTISGTDLNIVNSPNFETKSSYSIRIKVEDQGGLAFEKQFTITINDLIETSILKGSDGNALQLHPNPASDEVFVNLKGEANYRILDLQGKIHRSFTTAESKFSIEGLNSGVYMVEINQSGTVEMIKFIVK